MEQRSRAKVEVAQFDGSQSVSVDAENVLGLQVPVSDTLGVEELQGGGHVSDDVGGLLLSEIFPGLNVVEELASRDLLEYQVKSLRLLEILNELYDVGVTLIEKIDNECEANERPASTALPDSDGRDQSP